MNDLSIIERDQAAAYFAEGSNPDELDSGDGALAAKEETFNFFTT